MQISPYAIPGVKKHRVLPKKRYTPEELVQAIKVTVLNYYQLPESAVFSKRRDRELVTARNVMHYLAKQFTKLSLKKIGELFPGEKPLDHTSVLHSIRKTMDILDTEDFFRSQVIDMKQEIEGAGIELVRLEKETPKKVTRPAKKKQLPPPAPPKQVIRIAEPIPIIRMNTLSESEKVMHKYL